MPDAIPPNLYETPLMRRLISLQPTLNPALQKVAQYILSDPLNAATLRIHDIATATRTSTAAVHRLAKTLGLSGFIGLHEALVANLRDWVSARAGVASEVKRAPDDGFALTQQVRVVKGSLEDTLHSNREGMFEGAVDLLDSGERFYVLGFGHNYHLATLFAGELLRCGLNACAASTDGGLDNTAHLLAPIGPGDMLVALATPPYTRETIHLARYARGAGALVLALTDTPVSPLVGIAHISLYAPPDHAVLPNSKIAMYNVIEGLVAALYLRHRSKVSRLQARAKTIQTYMQGLDEPDPLDHPDMPPRKKEL